MCTRELAVDGRPRVGTGIAVLALTNRKLMWRGGLGRRGVMVCGGMAFLFGAALQAAAVHWWMLIVGRILLGVGIGFANEVRMKHDVRIVMSCTL